MVRLWGLHSALMMKQFKTAFKSLSFDSLNLFTDSKWICQYFHVGHICNIRVDEHLKYVVIQKWGNLERKFILFCSVEDTWDSIGKSEIAYL